MVKIFKIPHSKGHFLYRDELSDVYYAQSKLLKASYTYQLKNLDHVNLLEIDKQEIDGHAIDWYNKNINNLEKINKDTHPAFR